MKNLNLSMFGLVCQVIQPETKEIEKNYLLYTLPGDSFANSLDGLDDKITNYKGFEAEAPTRGTNGSAYYVWWKFNNKSVSRKKIDAFLRTIYDKQ